ncbi:MAG: hypothetical protein GY793_09985 [Proteobacteria bacterium]|nr:hypothetical protein [Pseudomonadota bacterium]
MEERIKGIVPRPNKTDNGMFENPAGIAYPTEEEALKASGLMYVYVEDPQEEGEFNMGKQYPTPEDILKEAYPLLGDVLKLFVDADEVDKLISNYERRFRLANNLSLVDKFYAARMFYNRLACIIDDQYGYTAVITYSLFTGDEDEGILNAAMLFEAMGNKTLHDMDIILQEFGKESYQNIDMSCLDDVEEHLHSDFIKAAIVRGFILVNNAGNPDRMREILYTDMLNTINEFNQAKMSGALHSNWFELIPKEIPVQIKAPEPKPTSKPAKKQRSFWNKLFRKAYH